MRVFWHNGALMIEPEGEREVRLLVELTGNLKLEKPPEMQNSTSGSGCASGGDSFLKLLIGDHQVNPSNLSGNLHNKKPVVCINKLP